MSLKNSFAGIFIDGIAAREFFCYNSILYKKTSLLNKADLFYEE